MHNVSEMCIFAQNTLVKCEFSPQKQTSLWKFKETLWFLCSNGSKDRSVNPYNSRCASDWKDLDYAKVWRGVF